MANEVHELIPVGNQSMADCLKWTMSDDDDNEIRQCLCVIN